MHERQNFSSYSITSYCLDLIHPSVYRNKIDSKENLFYEFTHERTCLFQDIGRRNNFLLEMENSGVQPQFSREVLRQRRIGVSWKINGDISGITGNLRKNVRIPKKISIRERNYIRWKNHLTMKLNNKHQLTNRSNYVIDYTNRWSSSYKWYGFHKISRYKMLQAEHIQKQVFRSRSLDQKFKETKGPKSAACNCFIRCLNSPKQKVVGVLSKMRSIDEKFIFQKVLRKL